ncbi:MAG: hypothetical protein L0H64_16535, partial [Pseudonocardia sp.]|nr:hypothetical protein [Pseudonocardia sp.]
MPGPAVPLPAALALALLAGAGWGAGGAPPRGWWPLLPLGVAALTIALHGRGLRVRLLLGTAAGAVLYGLTLGWLAGFAVAGYVAIAALETVMLAVAVALIPTARTGRWAGGW